MPDPTRRPFTEEQLSERFTPAGIDKATAERRLACSRESAPAEPVFCQPRAGIVQAAGKVKGAVKR